VETRLYNIEQEKISSDNVYQFPVFFNGQENTELDWDNESTVEETKERGINAIWKFGSINI
jgi:hypothetical protein